MPDIEAQKLVEDINTNSMCTNYRIFKTVSSFEYYLTLLDTSHRINLCKFRCRNHNLPVQKAKYDDECSPYCIKCSGIIGDEFHYLFECPIFVKERNIYIKSYYKTWPNTLKMNELFNGTDKKQLLNLAKFVGLIMSHFK